MLDEKEADSVVATVVIVAAIAIIAVLCGLMIALKAVLVM